MKTILIAVPTNRYIEPETFKSIYDLTIPNGYKTEFQFFYGYQIDQIRNLIAEWGKRYDYLFCVDSDIKLPKNALFNLIQANKDIVTGLYIQRIPNSHTLELYKDNTAGGMNNIPYNEIKSLPLVPVDGCGFGCVLIKGEVIRALPYPHFVYKSALDHRYTFSEDVYFCRKAKEHGFEIWADTTIKCEHIGKYTFKVDSDEYIRHVALRNMDLLPHVHVDYLKTLKIEPKVIYDIGSSVMHWTDKARTIWKDAQYFLVDATVELEELYKAENENYYIGVVSDKNNKVVNFYCDVMNPGGNSYYKENTAAYNESHKQVRTTITLDTIVDISQWPLPDLIKLDVQGSEIDILKGAVKCLSNNPDIILEAQHVDYNADAPKIAEVMEFMTQQGYRLVSNFCTTQVDGDYHFTKDVIVN